VHFYSNFGRKSWSNRGTPSKFLPRARSHARPPRRRPPPRAYRVPTPPTSASELSARHSRSPRAFPMQLAPSPRRAHAEAVERRAAVRPPLPNDVRSCPVIFAPARAAPPRPAAAPAYKGSAPAGPRTGGPVDRCTPAVGPCAGVLPMHAPFSSRPFL
jgi:hypothetical protein